MSKSRFTEHECPLAQSLDQVGDWWTLLVVREAMYGTCCFEDFRTGLGISRAILSKRLSQLVRTGILTKQRSEKDGRSINYLLTPKGRALWPVIVSLLTWSNQWLAEPGKEVIKVQSRTTGNDIVRLCALSSDDQPIDMKDTMLVEGPGASEAFRQRIQAINDPRKQPKVAARV